MTPLTVFLRALARSSAICLGAGLIVMNPSLDWSSSRPVTAQKSAPHAAVDALVTALDDPDAQVRRAAVLALCQWRDEPALLARSPMMPGTAGEAAALVLPVLDTLCDGVAAPPAPEAPPDAVRAQRQSR